METTLMSQDVVWSRRLATGCYIAAAILAAVSCIPTKIFIVMMFGWDGGTGGGDMRGPVEFFFAICMLVGWIITFWAFQAGRKLSQRASHEE
jgi:hypothetical protein